MIVIVAGVAKTRVWERPPPAVGRSAATGPTYMKDWRAALPVGVATGDPTAPVLVIELAELECPSCRAFHRALEMAGGLVELHPRRNWSELSLHSQVENRRSMRL